MEPRLCRKTKAYAKLVLLSLLTLAFALACIFMFDLDTASRRTRTNRQMQALADRIDANPDDKEALNKLISHLDDSYQWARTSAANRLGSLRSKAKGAVPALGKALNSNNPFLRRTAALALRDIGTNATAAIPDLIKALNLGNEDAAWFSAETLGMFREDAKTIAPALIGCLKIYDLENLYGDSGPQLAFEAADSLAKFGVDAQEAIPALKAGLSHTNIQLKFHFSSAIRAIDPQDEDSLKFLIELLNHPWMDSWALTTLGNLGTNSAPAIPSIENYLERQLSPSSRQHAEFALAKIRKSTP